MLASPAREVRNEDVIAEVQLGLVQDDPAPGPTTTAVERRTELFTERARGARMKGRWTWVRIEDAVKDLSDDVLRQALEIRERRGSSCRSGGHIPSLPRQRVRPPKRGAHELYFAGSLATSYERVLRVTCCGDDGTSTRIVVVSEPCVVFATSPVPMT